MGEHRAVDLDAGAGGLALGLGAAGWQDLSLVEGDEQAGATLHLNQSLGHPLASGWELYVGDVRGMKYGGLAGNVDLVAGSPPFLPSGAGGGTDEDDPRHVDLFAEAARALRDLAPRCFVFHAPRSLLRERSASCFDDIRLQLGYPSVLPRNGEGPDAHRARLERLHAENCLDDPSYRVVSSLLNAAEYGVPQNRHRVFIAGFRSDLGREWSFPEPTHSLDRLLWDQWVTGSYWDEHRVGKMLRPDFPAALAKRVDRLATEYPTEPPPGLPFLTVRDSIGYLPDPEVRKGGLLNHQFQPGARAYPGHTGSQLDEPAKSLKGGHRGLPAGENMIAFHLDGSCRYFTVREAARIQTFPDDYVFSGSWKVAMRQVAGAVPVRLAAAIGRSLAEQLD